MLNELRIENFAIIQNLEINFDSGLVILTGETGAGKSIILDAILMLMGRRVDTTFLRSGAQRASVEGAFRLSDDNRQYVMQVLQREDIPFEPDMLTFTRELRQGGRTSARINGSIANASLLREIGAHLVDIHGQSEHLSLLNVRQHLGLLDRYAGSEELLDAYQETYRKYLKLCKELETLRQNEIDAAEKIEFLTFQAQEIESANLDPGEEQELRQERDRLANAEALTTAAHQSLNLLEEGTEESPPVSDQLGLVLQSLMTLSRLDTSQEDLHGQTIEAVETLSEISRMLGDYLEEIEYNPHRLEQVEERLDLLNNLKRKYGGSIESIIAFGERVGQDLDNISHATDRIAELENMEGGIQEMLVDRGGALSSHRRQASDALAVGVEIELADLSMEGARFSVDLAHKPAANGIVLGDEGAVAFDEFGFDHVEFMIAPNPGEGFKPLVKTASGGETSRLMLALKNVLAQADTVPTLIFDEIDQGIGGRVGAVVGEKLWQLARQHQVLCVTHLPQLAAFGDQHLGVRKQTSDGRTLTHVERLTDRSQLDELAQMLGTLSDTGREAAQETLDFAHRRAAELGAGR
jgi:DNA repair protein RecN (Recombination protein N)